MRRAILLGKSLVFCIAILFANATFVSFLSSGERIDNVDNVQSAELRNIMVTGYWDPTGRMIAPFSNSSYLNPGGWKGANWEGYGYNIYAFFPTPGTYNGTFEVDYQDTWEDFWNITAKIHPIAIISFGAGRGPWEIEYNARNLDSWIDDEKPPYQPTPCPPDDSVPPGYVRHSTLPVQAIADAVNNQTSIRAWIDWNGNPGAYLCEYMAYLGMWYQDMHNSTEDPYPCKAAGFIHVKSSIPVKDAMVAANITIRETIKYLLTINEAPASPTITGPTEGKVDEEYEYEIVAADPEGEGVYYWIDWGDGNTEGWLGPYASGEKISLKHTWDAKGTYVVKAKAKDVHDAEGDWGTLEISIPFKYNVLLNYLQKLSEWLMQIFGREIIPDISLL